MVMHRSLISPRAASTGLLLILTLATSALAAPPAAEDARQRLDRGDARGAASLLESVLATAPEADRPALLDLLRRSYSAAAKQAEAAGKTAEAEEYRENLSILDRKPRKVDTKTAPPVRPEPPVVTLPPTRAEPRPGPVALPRAETPAPAAEPTAAQPLVTLPKAEEPTAQPPEAPLSAPPAAVNPPTTRAQSPTPAAPLINSPPAAPEVASTASNIRAADEAFLAERYHEAGKIYAGLDREGKLPAGRKDHWAYCRAVEVVSRINARPATPREWADIEAEIKAIRTLSPNHWFAEYLRNLVNERNREPKPRTTKTGKVVVRGSSPDEPAQNPPPVPVAPATPGPTGPATQVPWAKQTVASPNFIVRHVESQKAIAEQVARAAEAARDAQAKRWGPTVVPGSWDPRCEIVLFPTAADLTRETQQPPDSPGFSTMGMNEGRIVLRRIHLRGDHPNLVKAILPHEVTHVVLADIFPRQQVPRWADEGMAVLAEPTPEQSLRAADLEEPLRTGRLFHLRDLMVMDYPAQQHWALYYAQSVSLTRFLVETGSHARLVRLVESAQKATEVHLFGKLSPNLPPDHPQVRAQIQEAMRNGFTDALKEVYAINGYDDLQARWLEFARGQASGAAIAGTDVPTPAGEETARR